MGRAPIEVFDDQIGDAEQLLELARAMLRESPNGDGSPAARALLRQAVVATAAAVESYIALKAATFVRGALKSDDLPERLARLEIPLRDALAASAQTSPAWRFEMLICERLEFLSSTSPSQIGVVFSAVGKRDVLKGADGARGLPKGSCAEHLEALAKRRNEIAHRGDRTSKGRRKILVRHVDEHVRNAREVVQALEATL